MFTVLILIAAIAVFVLALWREEALRPYLVGSLVVQVLIFWLVFFFQMRWDMPVVTKITMIRLSKGDGGTNIRSNFKNSDTLPDSTLKEQKEVIKELSKGKEGDDRSTKESKTEKVVKIKKESQKTNVSETGAINPNKRTPDKTKTRMDDALARIDNLTKQREIDLSAAQSRNEDTGQSPYGSDQGNTIDPALIAYYNTIKSKIRKNWVKGEYAGVLRASIVVKIDANGNIMTANIEKKSTNTSFDDSAKRAVQRAAPFPPPPESIRNEVLTEGFEFDFNPTSVTGRL